MKQAKLFAAFARQLLLAAQAVLVRERLGQVADCIVSVAGTLPGKAMTTIGKLFAELGNQAKRRCTGTLP